MWERGKRLVGGPRDAVKGGHAVCAGATALWVHHVGAEGECGLRGSKGVVGRNANSGPR